MSTKIETGGVMGFVGPCQLPNKVCFGFDLEVRKKTVQLEPVTTGYPATKVQPVVNFQSLGVIDLHPTRSVVRIGPGQYVDRKTGQLLRSR